ncbi:sensor histidine kinase [Nocardioides sp.]|uniref:sensor histidine kinase n=1 Tax=Nocardioides sp. TaxID=35761 RepID=UPI003568E765
MSRHHAGERPDPGVPTAWSDAPSRDALQLIAEGVTEVAGFGVAAISVVRDDGRLEVMAVAGSDEARDHLTGVRTPVAQLMAEIDKADHWGLLRFLPHEKLEIGEEDWGWVPDVEPLDLPDAWHPMDLLIAPLRDQDGTLRGTLAMDLPRDGRRPGDAQRAVLQKYAEQAGRAVVNALEREELAEQVRLADAARTIVRNASAQRSMAAILSDSSAALTEGFRASGVWIHTFDRDGLGTESLYSSTGETVELLPEVVDLARMSARSAWRAQRSEVVAPDRPFGPTISQEQGTQVLRFLADHGIGSILFTPLGAGPECLGSLVLTRAPGTPEWSDVESAAALDIGHDLGRALLNARTFERERKLVHDLQELDAYKSRLIATVAHELKTPLAVASGHLELLESSPDLSADDRSSLSFIGRSTHRMELVIADLLMLARVGDHRTELRAEPVDLRLLVREAVELASLGAARGDLTVSVDEPEGPVLALGDASELERVCVNLLGNAVKYTPRGRIISLSVRRRGQEAVLTCTDQGLGISPEDQEQLFTEFFRSSNPEALAQPGTGLGLTIVKRIVERHRGRIEVESELGVGSTFRVCLPAV